MGQAAGGGELQRVLGVGFGVAAVVGSVIGVGILRVPGAIAGDFATPWGFLSVWVIAAGLAMLGANLVGELSSMMPRAGGPYIFIRRGFGDYAGFLFGWIDWMISIGSVAYMLVTLADFALRLVPRFPGGAPVLILATAGILVAVHLGGVKTGGRIQAVLSATKALAFTGFAIACLALGDQAGWRAPAAPVADLPWWAAVALGGRGMLMVIEAFAGWNTPVYMAEEQRDPARGVARSMLLGIAGVCGVYLLLNLGLLAVMPLKEIAGSTLPVADAMTRIAGPVGGTLVTLIAIVSLTSIVFTTLFQTPRVLLALSRDGWCHRGAARISGRGVPANALLVSATAILLLALSGSFELLFVNVAMLGLSTDAMVAASLFALRWREPEAPRPYRAWLFPWLPGLYILGALAVLATAAIEEPEAALRSLAVVGLSIPAYFWLRARHRRSAAGGSSRG